MHQVCIEKKITWPSFIHTSALKKLPLVVWVYTVGFVKCFDILFYFESVRSIVNYRKKIVFTVYCKFILQSFKLSLLTDLSELWLVNEVTTWLIKNRATPDINYDSLFICPVWFKATIPHIVGWVYFKMNCH